MKLISQFMVMFLLAGCTLGGEVTNKFGTILANKVLKGRMVTLHFFVVVNVGL